MSKTHRKTGLRYLGQTSQDPFKYPGSGVDWISHLKEFGDDVETAIILQTLDRRERNNLGRFYSKLWNIVSGVDDYGNKIWANKMPETGGGPGRTPESARAQALLEIEQGTHIFVRDNPSPKMVANGTHNFIGGEIQKKMVADGTHHLLSGEIQRKACIERVKNGTHVWLGPDNNNKRVEAGTHVFLGPKSNEKMLREGTHPSQNKIKCQHCGLLFSRGMFARWHGDKCKNKGS